MLAVGFGLICQHETSYILLLPDSLLSEVSLSREAYFAGCEIFFFFLFTFLEGCAILSVAVLVRLPLLISAVTSVMA